MLNFSRNLKKRAEQWHNFANVRFHKGSFENIPIKKVNVICMFNSLHFSTNIIKDLTNILSHLNNNGLLIISEPRNKTIFGKRLMNDQKMFERKLKTLAKAQQDIKHFLLLLKKTKKYKLIKEVETDTKYFVVIHKLK